MSGKRKPPPTAAQLPPPTSEEIARRAELIDLLSARFSRAALENRTTSFLEEFADVLRLKRAR
jgi:hypothetical protein